MDGFVQTVDASNPFPNLFCYLGVHFRTYYIRFQEQRITANDMRVMPKSMGTIKISRLRRYCSTGDIPHLFFGYISLKIVVSNAGRTRFYAFDPLMDCNKGIRDKEKCVRLLVSKDFWMRK